jgi:hypothetical protein
VLVTAPLDVVSVHTQLDVLLIVFEGALKHEIELGVMLLVREANQVAFAIRMLANDTRSLERKCCHFDA